MKKTIMDIFWSLPILSNEKKEEIYYKLRKLILKQNYQYEVSVEQYYREYVKQVLELPNIKNMGDYISISEGNYKFKKNDPKLIAYYLPQFYPFKENDEWWGKGTTEWNNVSRSVPQYLGHYQPRLPGELGYYDLRLKENIVRQVELAKLYGIFAFCYYFYWFDGKRLLDRPLDLFLESKEINFPFCLCWANENWTRRFESISGEVIMKQSTTVESYERFIFSLEKYFNDERYFSINGKKVLIVYQPTYIPNCEYVIDYWRRVCNEKGIGDIYIIAVKTPVDSIDFISLGFDALTEFQPRNVGMSDEIRVSPKDMKFFVESFYGNIFDYEKIITNKIYLQDTSDKLYKAVMPMWDNTPRRNNKGSIFHGSTPQLYQNWLSNVIKYTNEREDLDDKLVFINAWNEWGEGAYLEPDRRYGYAYLQATRNAIELNR